MVLDTQGHLMHFSTTLGQRMVYVLIIEVCNREVSLYTYIMCTGVLCTVCVFSNCSDSHG